MNPITRKEMFLAAAGGQDVTTPTPITREEVFLNEIAKGGGGSSLPSTETASVGDVLSLNDNKEPKWAAPGGSGGGVLVVHVTTSGNTMTLDKTWQEIYDSSVPVFGKLRMDAGDVSWVSCVAVFEYEGDFVASFAFGTHPRDFTAASASGYPSYTE